MARSAAALVAVLILSGFSFYQQVATHTVVRGDTLWDLSNRYYQTPWEWRRIWEANRDEVRDPNLIYPDQVLTIPGLEAEARVTEVVVEPPDAPSESPAGAERTVFYRGPSEGSQGEATLEAVDYLAVPRDAAYSAPWIVRPGEKPESVGRVEAFAGGAHASSTPRAFDRVRLSFHGAAPRVGDRFQTLRVFRIVEGVGEVVRPTGVVTIADVDERGAVAVVTSEYERVQLGDLVGELPRYGFSPGQYPVPVPEGPQAMIMAFAGANALHNVESIAFLDVGAEHGVTLGDEFDYVDPDAGRGAVEGRLQVVGVQPRSAAARIVRMDDVVFKPGLVVRLVRKMR